MNAADEALAGTVTDAGTDRAGALLARMTEAPDAGAAFDNVTVQKLFELAGRLVAAHWTAETRIEETSATEAVFEDSLRVAVIVAV